MEQLIYVAFFLVIGISLFCLIQQTKTKQNERIFIFNRTYSDFLHNKCYFAMNRNDCPLYAFSGKAMKKIKKYNLENCLNLVEFSNKDRRNQRIEKLKRMRKMSLEFKRRAKWLENYENG